MTDQIISKRPDNQPAAVEHKKRRWYDLSLLQAITVAIFVACILVAVAQLLYLGNRNHKYDINRPGNKYNPPQLSITDDTSIDTESPVTAQTLTSTTKMIKDQLNKLTPYGNFSDPALNSGSLDLTPPQAGQSTQPSQ